jgi:hypothetical protein
MHCLYLVSKDDLVTPEERDAWQDDWEDDGDAAIYLGDDILVFSSLPPDLLPRWALQPTVAHELGHGAGLGHEPEDASFESVMKPRRHARLVQAVDLDAYCRLHACRAP